MGKGKDAEAGKEVKLLNKKEEKRLRKLRVSIHYHDARMDTWNRQPKVVERTQKEKEKIDEINVEIGGIEKKAKDRDVARLYGDKVDMKEKKPKRKGSAGDKAEAESFFEKDSKVAVPVNIVAP
jgi:hypothetical protein